MRLQCSLLCLRALREGHRTAIYFLFSVILFFVATLVYFLAVFRFLDSDGLVFHLTYLGASFGLGLIILGLSRIIAFKSSRLLQKENHLKFIDGNLSDWVWQINNERKFTQNNYKLLKLLGYREDELFGQPFMQMINQSDYQLIDQAISLCLTEGKGFIGLPILFLTKSQKPIPMEVSGEAILDYNNNIVGLWGISHDFRQKHISRQTLLNAIHGAKENERKRLSIEIHDSIGPVLSGINLYLSTLMLNNVTPEKRNELIAKTKQSIREVSDELRQISNNLMPVAFINRTLTENISMLIHRLNPNDEISVSFSSEGFTANLTNKQNMEIYRIISELLCNTIKHANAGHIRISLTSDEKMVNINYADDGIGFDIATILKSSSGSGLRNIQLRLKTLNSTPNFRSSPENGMSLDFSFSCF